MKRRTDRRQLRLITEISITPLLNLVFVLLLILLVSAPLLKDEAPLMFPAAGTSAGARETPPERIVTLTVDQARSLTLDGRPVDRGGLTAALKQLVKEQSETAVTVQMHRDLPVASLVEIMDDLNGSGVRKTSVIATDPARQ